MFDREIDHISSQEYVDFSPHALYSADELPVQLENISHYLEGDDYGSLGGEELDIITLYLREIGSIPLLDKESETAYAKMLEAGRDAARILQDIPDHHESEVLRKSVEAGEYARDMLIKSNCRYVMTIAKQCKDKGFPLPFVDLIQEGNLGLIHAVDMFDYRRGRMTTYATFWIKQTIVRSIELKYNESMYRFRSKKERMFHRKFLKKMEELQNKLLREPTDKEIVDALDLSFDEYQSLRQGIFTIFDLDEPISSDSELTFLETLESSDNTENEVISKVFHEKIKHVILSPYVSPLTKVLLGLKYDVLTIESQEFQRFVSESGLDYDKILTFKKNFPEPTLDHLAGEFNISPTAVKQRFETSFRTVHRSITW